MKKNLFIIVISFLIISPCGAQTISEEVINNFQPAIVTRVFDIANTVKISPEQQLRIAKELDVSGKRIVEAIKAKGSKQEVERLISEENVAVLLILGRDAPAYANNKGKKFSSLVTSAESQYVQEKYNPDTILARRFEEANYNKNALLFSRYLLYGITESKALPELKKVLHRFDTLNFNFYKNLYASRVLSDFILGIRKAKPSVSDSIIVKIAKGFYKNSINSYYPDYSNVMLEVLQHVYPDTTVISYFFGKQIERQATFLASSEKFRIVDKDHVSLTGFDSIYPIVKKKYYQVAMVEYTYGGMSRKADSLIRSTSRKYDSLITAALIRDGSLIAYNQFAIALKYRRLLLVSDSLVEPLLSHAMRLWSVQDSIQKVDPYAKMDFKVYESKFMNELLTEDQYTSLLVLKNRSQATNDAENDWNDIVRWGIEKMFTEETVKRELRAYYLSKWNTYYRLAFDKVKQEASLQLLKDNQPKSLKVLSSAKKGPPQNENTALKIQW